MTADPMDTPTIVKVAEGFYVRQAVDNMAWIDLGGTALVVDTLEDRGAADEVFEAIASTLGDVPVRYVLNTHTHGDHVALNRAFQKRFGVEVVNQRVAPIPPQGRWIQGTERRVLMLPLPGCHTAEDCVVWVPDDRVLLTGDLFGWGLIPPNGGLERGVPELLLEHHARMIEFDAAVVVPGHGPNCTTAELRRWVEYFRWLRAQACRAVEQGLSDSQAAESIAPPDDMRHWWRFVQWKHADSLAKTLTAVRRGIVTE